MGLNGRQPILLSHWMLPLVKERIYFQVIYHEKKYQPKSKSIIFALHGEIIQMGNQIKVTAEKIHKELVEDFDIKNKIGSINLTLGGILVRYNGRDAVGHLLQEWISEWMKSKNYYFRTKPNTQEFPDLLLTDNDKEGLLEIKTFNFTAGPAFDIANFTSYCKSLLNFPERLYTDYLILGYEMENGELKIIDIWLKKVWEIAGTSGTNPINLQTKDRQPYNLRPVRWYSTRQTTNIPFTNKLEFLNSIKATHEKYPDYTSSYNDDWISKVKAKHIEKFGSSLE